MGKVRVYVELDSEDSAQDFLAACAVWQNYRRDLYGVTDSGYLEED